MLGEIARPLIGSPRVTAIGAALRPPIGPKGPADLPPVMNTPACDHPGPQITLEQPAVMVVSAARLRRPGTATVVLPDAAKAAQLRIVPETGPPAPQATGTVAGPGFAYVAVEADASLEAADAMVPAAQASSSPTTTVPIRSNTESLPEEVAPRVEAAASRDGVAAASAQGGPVLGRSPAGPTATPKAPETGVHMGEPSALDPPAAHHPALLAAPAEVDAAPDGINPAQAPPRSTVVRARVDVRRGEPTDKGLFVSAAHTSPLASDDGSPPDRVSPETAPAPIARVGSQGARGGIDSSPPDGNDSNESHEGHEVTRRMGPPRPSVSTRTDDFLAMDGAPITASYPSGGETQEAAGSGREANTPSVRLHPGALPRDLGAADVHRVRLEVDPPELGRCELELTLRDDTVYAVVVAERAETVAALRAVEADVRAALADRNLQVTQFDVRQGGGDAAGGSRHDGTPVAMPAPTPRMNRAARPQVHTAPPPLAAAEHRVDLVA